MKYIESKEELIKIDNSKISTKQSTKHCNSKEKLAYYDMFSKMSFFSSQIYLKAIFVYCPRFFIPTKNLNTARTPTEMKQNMLH